MEWIPRKDDISGAFDSSCKRFRLVPETVKGGWLLLDFASGASPSFKWFMFKAEAITYAELAAGEEEIGGLGWHSYLGRGRR